MKIFFTTGLVIAFLSLTACGGTPPTNLGLQKNALIPCPSSPNCVGSNEAITDETHYIKPLPPLWNKLPTVLKKQNITIIKQGANYIYATSTSRLFRFVDDVEFHYQPKNNIIAVRSASRLGKSDLGVNRKRIEAIRSALTSD